MYLYSLGMWYKLRFSLGKLYDDLEPSELPDFETFLTGQDLPDSPLRKQVYDQLECTSEEDFQSKLSEIKSFYKKMSDTEVKN
jgi:hypothetical protein